MRRITFNSKGVTLHPPAATTPLRGRKGTTRVGVEHIIEHFALLPPANGSEIEDSKTMQNSTLSKQPLQITKNCELCGQVFHRNLDRRRDAKEPRFCSVTCRNRHLARQQKKRVGKVCPECGHYGPRQADLCKPCGGVAVIRRPGKPDSLYAQAWSPEELTYLKTHYPHDGAASVAKALDKTHLQVRNAAARSQIRLTGKTRQQIVSDATREHMINQNPMKRPEVKAKVRAWAEAHPEEMAIKHQKLAEGHARLQRDKPSGLETKLRALLTDFGVAFEFSVSLKPKFVVDIRIDSIIIEADGDYWHGHPRFEPLTERQQAQQKRDRARDKYLIACGYTVIRIWESDMTRPHVESILKEHSLIPN